MNDLIIFGTSSDAGKSTFALALSYLLKKAGYSVAPFKAQNVSNNSIVCDDGGEIAIAQGFIAKMLHIPISNRFNPVLIKSGSKQKAHLILRGESVGEEYIWGYYKNIDKLKPIVKEAYESLKKDFDIVVAEGAGSPVELNLMQKDLSNIFVATTFEPKIILVADIERGGVFASIYGVYHLLPKELQKRVVGVVINKFRGDLEFFKEGVAIIQKQFGLKVLGVIPYKPLNLAFEDSASLQNYTQNKPDAKIKVAIIKLPHISNFNDFEPLILDEEIVVEFVTTPNEAKRCDLLIVPGSKRVVSDLLWLQKQGFSKVLESKRQTIVAICGGYEMMHERIYDPDNIESEFHEIEGFGRFKGDVVFQKEKITKKGWYNLFGVMVEGFEIHHGVAKKRAKRKKRLYGTFVHGLFESDVLREQLFRSINPSYQGYNYKKRVAQRVEEFCMHVQEHIDFQAIKDAVDGV